MSGRKTFVLCRWIFGGLFLLLLSAFGGNAIARSSTLYPAPLPPAHPADNPPLPAEMDIFKPPVAAQNVGAAAPVFGEWSHTISPDETLTAFGANFAAAAGGGFVVFGQTTASNARTVSADIASLDEDNRVLVRMPKTLPPNSAYLLWAKNSAGYGQPVLVNATETWWVGPNNAHPGDTVSLYGRNLASIRHTPENEASSSVPGAVSPATISPVSGAPALFLPGTVPFRAWIYLKPTAGAGFWAQVTEANPCKVDFILPASLAPGTYEVWAHNGHAGLYGWSGPVSLNVTPQNVWTGPVYNVRDFGATPDDGTDDEAALYAAFEAAATHPYSTVYFPAGTYHASRSFFIPSNVRVRGDGMNASRLAVHPNFVAPPNYDGRAYCLLFGSGSNFLVQDMTFDTNHNANGYLPTLVYQRGVSAARYERVRFQADEYTAFDFHEASNLTLKDCEIVSNTCFLGSIRQAFFDGCTFKGTYDSNQLIATFGNDHEIAFTRCTARDLNPADAGNGAGWAQGRFVVFQSHWGSISDIYYGDNQTVQLGPRPGFNNQNTGEQFLLEVGPTDLTLTPTAVQGRVLNVSPLPAVDSIALVVSGRGIGQVRRVTAADTAAGTVTLDSPLLVAPDATTRIAFGRYADRIAVYHNRFDGKASQVVQSDHVATTAVYAQATSRLVVEANTLTNMRASFSCFNIYDPNGSFPNAWVDIVNNTITGTRNGIGENTTSYGAAVVGILDPTALAHTYRNNTIKNGIGTGFGVYNSLYENGTPLRNIVCENNRIDAPAALDIQVNANGSYTPGQVYLRNNRASAPPVQSLFTDSTPAQDNLTDGVPYAMGLKFKISVAGKVTALRYWKPSLEAGSHIGQLWKQDGTLLATVTFTSETSSGWQQANLAAPVSLTAGTTYVVTVNCNAYYPDTTSAFNRPYLFYSLTALADGNNGVFGPPGTLPTGSYANSNYFRDIVFVPTP